MEPPSFLNEKELFEIDVLRAQQAYDRRVSGIAHFEAGHRSFKQGDMREAFHHWQRASWMVPEWDLPYLQLALTHPLYDNDQQAALHALQRALELNRENPRTYYLLGITQYHLGQVEVAENHFKEAIRRNPDFEDAHLRLANLYREQGRPAQAISEYGWLLKRQPDNVSVLSIVAILYEDTKEYQKTEETLQQLIRLQGNTSLAYLKLAQFYQRRGRSREASLAQKRSDELNPRKQKRRNMRPLLPSRR